MCGFMETSETSKNWKTGSCFDLESYACKIPAGRSIHPAPKPTREIQTHFFSFEYIYFFKVYDEK